MNEEEYGIRMDEHQVQVAQAKALERIATALEGIANLLENYTGYDSGLKTNRES